MNNHLLKSNGFIDVKNTDEIVYALKSIIDLSQKQVYQAVNTAMMIFTI